MQTTIESYQNQTKNIQSLDASQLDNLYSTVYDLIGKAIDNDDLELHNQILPILRAIKKEIQNRNEVISTQPVTSQNIDEKIKDLKITNFYEIVSSKSSFQEAYDFVKNNYTKKELLLIDNSIPDYEGYNWKKDEGIRHLICSIKFNIAS